MKVTGISFIKNAVKFDYPIQEAILSILPICDEVLVAVGDCDDGTRELVQSIHPTKIKIIDTIWNKKLNTDGIVLADETNKVLQQVDDETNWIVYIQGDEVLHESGYETIKKNMELWKNDKTIDGLLLKYHHFYGSYKYIAISSRWYRNEIRIIKNDKTIYSYKDAQGFRKQENEKLKVKAINAYMHHYGWVKEPTQMMDKLFNAGTLWQASNYEEERVKHHAKISFDYSEIDSLNIFKGTHPSVMNERIKRKNWNFDYDISFNNFSLKEKFKNFLYKLTGKEFFSYKNYKL